MKEIPLTQGRVALVDDADFEVVSRFNWSLHVGHGSLYARRKTLRSERLPRRHITLHQFLVDATEVDHINGDGLDNRRENLRAATHVQNGANQRVPRNSTTGFKGVSKRRTSRNWGARIRVDGHLRHLGMYPSPEAAAKAYDEAARAEYGAFAALNFPNPGEQSARRPTIGAA